MVRRIKLPFIPTRFRIRDFTLETEDPVCLKPAIRAERGSNGVAGELKRRGMSTSWMEPRNKHRGRSIRCLAENNRRAVDRVVAAPSLEACAHSSAGACLSSIIHENTRLAAWPGFFVEIPASTALLRSKGNDNSPVLLLQG